MKFMPAHALRLAAVFFILIIETGCAGLRTGTVPVHAAGKVHGYLDVDMLPDSAAILPPPPADGSAALALDQEMSRKSLMLRQSPRWALAVKDADLSMPAAAESFSCALNVPISLKDTPHLYNLLQRTLKDAGHSTDSAKKLYKRTRPFMENGEPTCTPDWDANLRRSGSYPSSHSALGWAWALILTEISPDRGDALITRGLAFGQSRVVCNVHWESDVIGGRIVGAALVARLHSDPAFRADMEAARKEVATLRAKGIELSRECGKEMEAPGDYP